MSCTTMVLCQVNHSLKNYRELHTFLSALNFKLASCLNHVLLGVHSSCNNSRNVSMPAVVPVRSLYQRRPDVPSSTYVSNKKSSLTFLRSIRMDNFGVVIHLLNHQFGLLEKYNCV